MHDARVLRNTQVSKLLDQGFKETKVAIKKDMISPYLVGDSAYPLTESLVKPFSDSTMDPAENKFNRELSRARVGIECAFGVLKSRFRILMTGCEDQLTTVNQTISACCVLHNICVQNDDIGENTAEEAPCSELKGTSSFEGEELRDILKDFINQTIADEV